MSDADPRGHEDGDIAVGRPEEREEALDLEVDAFLLSLAEEQGHGPDQLADACARAVAKHQKIIDALKQAEKILRHGRLRGEHG